MLEFDITASMFGTFQHKVNEKWLYFTTKDAGSLTAQIVSESLEVADLKSTVKIFMISECHVAVSCLMNVI